MPNGYQSTIKFNANAICGDCLMHMHEVTRKRHPNSSHLPCEFRTGEWVDILVLCWNFASTTCYALVRKTIFLGKLNAIAWSQQIACGLKEGASSKRMTNSILSSSTAGMCRRKWKWNKVMVFLFGEQFDDYFAKVNLWWRTVWRERGGEPIDSMKSW